jgi:hypothetical protein
VSAGDEADQQLLDDVALADDDARDRVAQRGELVELRRDDLFGDGLILCVDP